MASNWIYRRDKELLDCVFSNIVDGETISYLLYIMVFTMIDDKVPLWGQMEKSESAKIKVLNVDFLNYY